MAKENKVSAAQHCPLSKTNLTAQQQTSTKQKIPAKKDANVKKAAHKRRVKGTSEVDNPKYASMVMHRHFNETATYSKYFT